MRSRSGLVILVALISLFVIEARTVEAYNYNESVSQNVPFGSAWTAQMQLDQGQTVRVDLSSNGLVDFYFMDSSGYSQFEATMNSGGQGQFSYSPSLSQLGSSSIDKTARIPASGTYYVVVPNMDNFNTIHVSGRVTATSGGASDLLLVNDWIWIVVLIASVIVIFTALLYVAWKVRPKPRRTYGDELVSRISEQEPAIQESAQLQQPWYVPKEVHHSSSARRLRHQGTTYAQVNASHPTLVGQEETRFCRHCGERIPADSTFCEHCGKR